MRPVWIIDDDRSIRWVFEKALTRENIPFKTFSSAQEALAALSGPPPKVVVSDIRMPGGSGLELLQQIKVRFPALPVIIMTAYSDLESAVSAFQSGAFEYLPKPFDVDQAVDLIRRAMTEVDQGEEPASAEESAPEILGQATSMQEVFRAIGRLTQSQATVLINGESGTGKELVARALHRHSPRGSRPFVAINTAAIPKDLLESELFGHERGAFTGAQTMRRGRFEQAEGGTLFLTCRPGCCACCRTVRSTGLAVISRSARTCASSPRRTRISKPGSSRGCSARICSTGSMSSGCVCPACASGARTCRCWRSISWPRARANSASNPSG
jgi:two-component system nitrogen regulation response regulator GlnG